MGISVEGSDDVQNGNTECLEFLPNIESTRLAPNARDELPNDDISSGEAGSDPASAIIANELVYYSPAGEDSRLSLRTVARETNAIHHNPSSKNNLNVLNLPSQQNMEQDDTSNTAHHSQELEKRLKSIGCWGNVDEVASSLLKQQKKRELETAAKEIKARKESRTNPRFKTKKA